MIQVLIVEDDPMVKEINEGFLKKLEGFQLCGSASSIVEAKEIISKKRLDLILLDVFFPKERGIDLLKWIRKENFEVDVILITADKSIKTVEEAFRYGAVDYLIKPFVFKRFEAALLKYKKRMDEFRSNEVVEQETIDRMTLKEKKPDPYQPLHEEVKNIKGFSFHTYTKIFKHICGLQKSFTAQEIANDIGISRITARRYLEFLEEKGIVGLEMEYGKVGRPQNKYRMKNTKVRES